MLFILVAIVLLGGIAVLLFVAVRQGRMLRALVEDIHHDLISFKSTADMNRILDGTLAEIRAMVHSQGAALERYQMDMGALRDLLADREKSGPPLPAHVPGKPLLDPPKPRRPLPSPPSSPPFLGLWRQPLRQSRGRTEGGCRPAERWPLRFPARTAEDPPREHPGKREMSSH